MTISKKSSEEIEAAAKQNMTYCSTTIPCEVDAARHLLENYSNIAPAQIDAHIHDIRNKAWAVFPYGCIGSFWFLNLAPVIQDPLFQKIPARLKTSGEVFLDLGCGLGQVVRHLISRGVSSDQLYAIDLEPSFLDLGFELFRDRHKNKATFLAADILHDDNATFRQLRGQVDIIFASAFFHLFEREDQVKAAKRLVGFLRPENPNVVVFGQQGFPMTAGREKRMLDATCWQGLWNEVGEATGTSWTTEMQMETSSEWVEARFAVYRKT